jgi:hypothetical protein
MTDKEKRNILLVVVCHLFGIVLACIHVECWGSFMAAGVVISALGIGE